MVPVFDLGRSFGKVKSGKSLENISSKLRRNSVYVYFANDRDLFLLFIYG